jgi:hypothetical protein
LAFVAAGSSDRIVPPRARNPATDGCERQTAREDGARARLT